MTFVRILRYVVLRAGSLFVTVVIGVYLAILIANMGGYVDEIRKAQIREQIADVREHARVRRRVRARRAPDGRLVDVDHLVDVLEAVDAVEGRGRRLGAAELLRERAQQRVDHERRLPRSRHARHAREHADRVQIAVLMLAPAPRRVQTEANANRGSSVAQSHGNARPRRGRIPRSPAAWKSLFCLRRVPPKLWSWAQSTRFGMDVSGNA